MKHDLSNSFLYSKLCEISDHIKKLESHARREKISEQPEHIHTVESLAKVLGEGITATRKKLSSGEIPFSKPTKRIYILHSDVLDYLERIKVKTNNPVKNLTPRSKKLQTNG